ncbi:MAG: carbonic anhydrase [Anaerovoracaceae bacterium]|nr:carbonic anhydrase [Bacillota bacterium]MDY2670012.1 carbonic anhydrase [Anaerovoracaceae bacterium]
MNSREALEKLKKGNRKFRGSKRGKSLISSKLRLKLAKKGQHPFACVISCSDSRVVPEMIFSADLGDIFTVRTAGNVINAGEEGSVEYVVEHLGVPLVVVMGHTLCGAVSAALSSEPDGSVKAITDRIKEAIGDETDPDRCAWLNAESGVKHLLQHEGLASLVAEGKLDIIPALYHTKSGRVTFGPLMNGGDGADQEQAESEASESQE